MAYGFELSARSLDSIIFFIKLEYYGVPFISALWILIGYKMRFNKKLSVRFILLIMTIPFLTLILSNTNEYHHLVYKDISTIEVDGGYLLADIERGPWYYINIIYNYAALPYNLVSLYRTWQNGNKTIKLQAKTLFLGLMWPGLATILYFSGISPFKVDLIPFGLAISGIFLYIAIFNFGFLDIKEIARDITFMEMSEGIIVFDNKNRLADFNKYSKKVFPWLNSNLIGTDISSCEGINSMLMQEEDCFELSIDNNSNKIYEVNKTILYEKGRISGTVFFIRDITKHKEMLVKLSDMANYDELTKIYNRRRLMEEAEKEFLRFKRNGKYISALMVDIDNFKKVNDNFGHQAGDEVIKVIADLLKDRIRKTDIIGRYGGEEFLIILPDTNEASTYKFAEEVRELVKEKNIVYADKFIKVTISIGVKSVNRDEEEVTLQNMIQLADSALYKAKNSGRNKTCIYS